MELQLTITGSKQDIQNALNLIIGGEATASTKTRVVKPKPEAEDRELITLDDVRKLVHEKSADHRETIKGYLKEYGVSKLPDLSTDSYAELMEKLNKLK